MIIEDSLLSILRDGKRSCLYKRYKEYASLCSYEISAGHLYVDPYSLFRNEYTIFCYKMTYQAKIPPLLSQRLKQDSTLPLLVTRKRSRPQKQRLRESVQKQSKQSKQSKQIGCSNP
jgi:hypothetical protein